MELNEAQVTAYGSALVRLHCDSPGVEEVASLVTPRVTDGVTRAAGNEVYLGPDFFGADTLEGARILGRALTGVGSAVGGLGRGRVLEAHQRSMGVPGLGRGRRSDGLRPVEGRSALVAWREELYGALAVSEGEDAVRDLTYGLGDPLVGLDAWLSMAEEELLVSLPRLRSHLGWVFALHEGDATVTLAFRERVRGELMPRAARWMS